MASKRRMPRRRNRPKHDTLGCKPKPKTSFWTIVRGRAQRTEDPPTPDIDEPICHCGLPEKDHKYPGAAEHNFVAQSPPPDVKG